MTRKIAQFFAMAMFAASFAPSLLHAADGGTVVGTVVDAGHHAVSGMTVRATDVVDPSKNYTAVTDNDGKFSIPTLPAGSYLVSADTVNTAWIQKDDSPILEVSANAQPNVMLVLVKTSELSPGASGGAGGSRSLEVTAIAVGSLGLVGTIVALVNIAHVDSDVDRLQDDNSRLQGDLNNLHNDNTNLMLELQQLLQEQARLQADINTLHGDHTQLENQLKDLQNQIKKLNDLINKRLPASPSR